MNLFAIPRKSGREEEESYQHSQEQRTIHFWFMSSNWINCERAIPFFSGPKGNKHSEFKSFQEEGRWECSAALRG